MQGQSEGANGNVGSEVPTIGFRGGRRAKCRSRYPHAVCACEVGEDEFGNEGQESQITRATTTTTKQRQRSSPSRNQRVSTSSGGKLFGPITAQRWKSIDVILVISSQMAGNRGGRDHHRRGKENEKNKNKNKNKKRGNRCARMSSNITGT